MTVVLINRSLTEKKTVTVNFAGFKANPGQYTMYSLSNLGSSETFVSHTSNALKKIQVDVTASDLTVELAPLSVNSVVLKSLVMGTSGKPQKASITTSVYPNPATDRITIDFYLPAKDQLEIELFHSNGLLVKNISKQIYEAGNHFAEINTMGLNPGIYLIRITFANDVRTHKLIIRQ